MAPGRGSSTEEMETALMIWTLHGRVDACYFDPPAPGSRRVTFASTEPTVYEFTADEIEDPVTAIDTTQTDMVEQIKSSKVVEIDADNERHPFLGSSTSSAVTVPSSGPVRLTPGWEDSTPPFDDILQNSSMNLSQPPKDRWNLVYFILVIHGIGVLMPWNMFINAKAYFVEYKLGADYTGNNTDGTEYAQSFMPYVTFASQLPNVFFNWLNLLVQIGGSLKTRIVCSIVIEAILFVCTVVLAMVDTSEIPVLFFWMTMGAVVLINMAGGIYQNSIFGIASKLDYGGAVVLGSNISGTFTAIINIGSIWLAPSQRTRAIYYFLTALLVLLICFDSYFALPLNKFYRYHETRSAREAEKRNHNHSQIGIKPRIPYIAIFKKCWPQCLNVFMVFFVTLAVFPSVQSDVKMVDPGFMDSDYFTAVTCFLNFNVCAMLGSMLPGLFTWPGPRWLWLPVVLRFGLLPFFYLCNYQPSKGIRSPGTVLIDNDWIYTAGGAVLGLTGGYFSSLAMMYCPRTVENQHAPVAGMFGAAFLITGIFAGVMTTFASSEIVKLMNNLF